MKSVIHKISLRRVDLNSHYTFQLPKGALILNIQIQDGGPVMWYVFDKSNENDLEGRKFHCIGTGISHDFQRLVYIATVQSGPYVLHFFEEI